MTLTFHDFSEASVDTCDQRPDPLTYGILGLGGEGGEVAVNTLRLLAAINKTVEKYKKAMREVPPDLLHVCPESEPILDELGDVLWYVDKIAQELGTDLEYVAQKNIRKLKDRRGEM